MSTIDQPTATTPAPVKRACDSCHRRKVKCVGEGTEQCKNCRTAGLKCTYDAIPQKKGPKGSRAKVLSELRESQQRHIQYPNDFTRFDGRTVSPAWAKTPGLLTQDLANNCAEYYFTHLYPTQPILHRQRLGEYLMAMDQSLEPYCFMSAFCAYIMMQQRHLARPGTGIYGDTTQPSNAAYGDMLLEEAIRVRKNGNYTETPTTLTVLTSYYLYNCFWNVEKHTTAWFHLREATTHALSLEMQDEESYKAFDLIDASRRRRLYWLLFVTERTFAIHKHRPLTLHASIHQPSVDEDPTEQVVLTGFIHLINLYKPFDDAFIGLWNKIQPSCLPTWLLQLQDQLENALPPYLEATEAQVVDLRTSQVWLKTMVWQLSLSHQFISSMIPDNSMSYKYPVDLSREWITLSSQFSQQAMEVHGVGLIEKLYDISSTLTDVLSYDPMNYHQSLDQNFDSSFSNAPPSPRDYLSRYLNLISTLRANSPRYTSMLMDKVNEMLPGMSAQLNQHLSINPNLGPSSASGYDPHSPNVSSVPNSATGLSNNSQHFGSAGSVASYGSTLQSAGPTPVNASASTSPVFDDAASMNASLPNPGMPLRPNTGSAGSHNVNVSVSLSQYTDSKPSPMSSHGLAQAHPLLPSPHPQSAGAQGSQPNFPHAGHHAGHGHALPIPHQQHQQHGSQNHPHISPHTSTSPAYGFPPPGTSMAGYPDSAIAVSVGGPGGGQSGAGTTGMFGVG